MSIFDMNNDKLNDLVMIDESRQTVSVHYYDDSSLSYAQTSSFDLPSGWFVDNIIPTTVPKEYQDLIIVASNVDDTTDALSTRLFYYTQQRVETTGSQSMYSWSRGRSPLDEIKLYPGTQPITLDIDGDQA